MKIAFVHCRIQPGWAYNVLKNLIETTQRDNAKIFTFISHEHSAIINKQKIDIIGIFPKRLSKMLLSWQKSKRWLIKTITDYRNFIVFAPIITRIISQKIKKYNPDKVIISSFALTKNIKTPFQTTLYLHSPMQYIRTHYEEYKQKITGRKWYIFRVVAPLLQKRDQKPRFYDTVYTNSKYTQHMCKQLYKQESTVSYPPVNRQYRNKKIQEGEHKEYFVYDGRLVSFVKEVDRIIHACNTTKTPLIIIGSWPDEMYLKSLAGDSIIFVPWIDDHSQRIQIIQGAKALINITKESFGISTAEAMLLGVPILWYNQWATPELVDKHSGVLINDKEQDTIINALESIQDKLFDRTSIKKHIQKIIQKNPPQGWDTYE